MSQLHLEYAKLLKEEERKKNLPLGLKHPSSSPPFNEKMSVNSSLYLDPKPKEVQKTS